MLPRELPITELRELIDFLRAVLTPAPSSTEGGDRPCSATCGRRKGHTGPHGDIPTERDRERARELAAEIPEQDTKSAPTSDRDVDGPEQMT